MKNKIFFPLFLLAALLFAPGCDHDTDTFDGPNLVDRFGEFSLIEGLQISQPTVDFSSGETVFFTAKFNKRINFQVFITGSESGAVKLIEGFDSELNAGNATWSGGTTDLPLFRDEMCSVELLIPEADSLSFTGEVEVLGTKVYEGSLFTDFEEDPVDDILFGNFEFELTANTGRTNDGKAAQGDWYYYFEGTDNVVPNFFTGLIDIKASITGETYAPLPTTVPEDLFFNCFVLSDAGPHGIAVIQIIYDSNDSGEFEDGQDAAFPIGDLNLNWVGWRHISVNLAEIGMTEEQVSKIVAVRALLISDMNSQPSPPLQVGYGLDFITFTAGGPLEL
jgi:hypothetical protein